MGGGIGGELNPLTLMMRRSPWTPPVREEKMPCGSESASLEAPGVPDSLSRDFTYVPLHLTLVPHLWSANEPPPICPWPLTWSGSAQKSTPCPCICSRTVCSRVSQDGAVSRKKVGLRDAPPGPLLLVTSSSRKGDLMCVVLSRGRGGLMPTFLKSPESIVSIGDARIDEREGRTAGRCDVEPGPMKRRCRNIGLQKYALRSRIQ